MAAFVVALAIGVAYGSTVCQSDNCFSANLEALSLEESNGKIKCYYQAATFGEKKFDIECCRDNAPCAHAGCAYVRFEGTCTD